MTGMPAPVVVVVDDDSAVRDSLRFALEQEGMKVLSYRDGAHLLAAPALPAAGCLVVDFYMPDMNGVDLIRDLRGRSVWLPAILITAKATDDMRRRAADVGVRMVLEKPLEDSALIDGIRLELRLQEDLRNIP